MQVKLLFFINMNVCLQCVQKLGLQQSLGSLNLSLRTILPPIQ
jgi:hypothetical protein